MCHIDFSNGFWCLLHQWTRIQAILLAQCIWAVSFSIHPMCSKRQSTEGRSVTTGYLHQSYLSSRRKPWNCPASPFWWWICMSLQSHSLTKAVVEGCLIWHVSHHQERVQCCWWVHLRYLYVFPLFNACTGRLDVGVCEIEIGVMNSVPKIYRFGDSSQDLWWFETICS